MPQTIALNPSDGAEWIRSNRQPHNTHYFMKKEWFAGSIAAIIFGGHSVRK
jgi:hypothetical protein